MEIGLLLQMKILNSVLILIICSLLVKQKNDIFTPFINFRWVVLTGQFLV